MFPTEKKSKKALFNRIFSIAGLSIGGAILAGLIVYVARTMDVRALLASIQPLWLLGAALCVPLSESVDALIASDKVDAIVITAWDGVHAEVTNKAIADQLYLSIHTVITHRRNIARKLQIHSPAGLTIYAIVNKLVELQDIKDNL